MFGAVSCANQAAAFDKISRLSFSCRFSRRSGHPSYQRLNQVLDRHAFDAFVEAQRAPFYATTIGRPSLTPGTYFWLLLIGYFEGIDSERGIAWRTADSLALRGFLGLGPRRSAARVFDDLADAPADRREDAIGPSSRGSCRCWRLRI